jgi:hypothetical protein
MHPMPRSARQSFYPGRCLRTHGYECMTAPYGIVPPVIAGDYRPFGAPGLSEALTV